MNFFHKSMPSALSLSGFCLRKNSEKQSRLIPSSKTLQRFIPPNNPHCSLLKHTPNALLGCLCSPPVLHIFPYLASIAIPFYKWDPAVKRWLIKDHPFIKCQIRSSNSKSTSSKYITLFYCFFLCLTFVVLYALAPNYFSKFLFSTFSFIRLYRYAFFKFEILYQLPTAKLTYLQKPKRW